MSEDAQSNVPPRAVIVDVDGTLYRQAPVRRRMALRLLRYVTARPLTGWRVVRALRAYREAQERLREAGGAASQQGAEAAQSTGYPATWVEAVAREWMEERPLDCVAAARYPGVAEFGSWARERNVRLAALSDYPACAKLKALGMLDAMAVVVCAQDAEVNVFKPDPKGLRATLARLGVEPAHAVYVGDRSDVDGAVARAAGVPAFILRAQGPLPDGVRGVANWGELRAEFERRFRA